VWVYYRILSSKAPNYGIRLLCNTDYVYFKLRDRIWSTCTSNYGNSFVTYVYCKCNEIFHRVYFVCTTCGTSSLISRNLPKTVCSPPTKSPLLQCILRVEPKSIPTAMTGVIERPTPGSALFGMCTKGSRSFKVVADVGGIIYGDVVHCHSRCMGSSGFLPASRLAIIHGPSHIGAGKEAMARLHPH